MLAERFKNALDFLLFVVLFSGVYFMLFAGLASIINFYRKEKIKILKNSKAQKWIFWLAVVTYFGLLQFFKSNL